MWKQPMSDACVLVHDDPVEQREYRIDVSPHCFIEEICRPLLNPLPVGRLHQIHDARVPNLELVLLVILRFKERGDGLHNVFLQICPSTPDPQGHRRGWCGRENVWGELAELEQFLYYIGNLGLVVEIACRAEHSNEDIGYEIESKVH